MNFSNYNLISTSKEDIIDFCKNIYKQYQTLKPKIKTHDTINIAVNNLYYMFDSHEIKMNVERYNINYISSYRIDTIDDTSLIILNPTNSGTEFLKRLEFERTVRLNLILNDLLMYHNIYIDIDELVNLKRIRECEITEVHLCYYILDLIKRKELKLKYENIKSIYDNILKNIYDEIPLKKYTYRYIVQTLFDENIILANPSEHIDKIETPELTGIIMSPFLKPECIEIAKQHNKDILPGTGELI